MASHMVLMKRDLMEVTKKSLRKITEKLDPMVLMEEIALKKIMIKDIQKLDGIVTNFNISTMNFQNFN